MKNRWIIAVTIILSVLFHLGVGLFFWKGAPALSKKPVPSTPMFVDMVNAPPLPDKTRPPGRIVDQPLPANEKRPNRAEILGYKDHRVNKQTHLRDTPFNELPGRAGPKGTGGPGGKTSREKGAKQPEAPTTSSELIASAAYRNLPKSSGTAKKGGGSSGTGNLSPYNPKIGSPGDAISLNTKSFKYMSYFAGIKEKIEWAWVYPQQAQMQGQQGILTLSFTILRNGTLKEVKLVNSSGYQILDRAAILAVRDAAGFGPMPSNWEDKELTIMANFHYRLIGAKSVY
jgi:TonB family protein